MYFFLSFFIIFKKLILKINKNMDRIRRTFESNDDDQQDNIITDVIDASSLSWSTRLKCFGVCFAIGVSCSILGTIFLWTNIRLFAVFYTFGSISTLSGSFFLMGPVKQFKNMFKEKRLIASIVMLVSLVFTLMAAFWWKKNILALLFCIIQCLAMAWYCISYIPFARDAVKKCFAACMG